MIKTLLFIAVMAIAGAANAQAGTLDSSFGTNGVRTFVGPDMVFATPDGVTYAVVENLDYGDETRINIAKYLPDGSLDQTYGNGGYSETLDVPEVDALALQPDGKLVVSGAFFMYNGNDETDELTARFTTGGFLDHSFNGVGYTIYSDGYRTYQRVLSVMTGANLIAVISNPVIKTAPVPTYVLTVYDLNGHRLFTKGLNPIVQPGNDYDPNSYNFNAAIQGDKIILSISSVDHYTSEGEPIVKNSLVRYNADGSVDPSFHPEAFLTLVGDRFTGPILVKPDGKIIITGYRTLYGLNSDGTIDNSFGSNGQQDIGNLTPDIIISQGDKIITQSSGWVVSRFNSNGSPDVNFGIGGSVTTNLKGTSLTVWGNRLLVSGTNSYGTPSVAAYKLQGPATNLTCPHDTTVYVEKGFCSAVVNGIDPTTSATSVTYTLSGVNNGSGSGSASGLRFNRGVTDVTYSIVGTSPCTFHVTVIDTGVTILNTFPDITLCSGATAEFTVVTKGTVLSYEWVKNNIVGQIQTSPTLKLTNVTSADAGKYQVFANGNCMAASSNTFTLKVNSPLKVSIPNAYTIDYYLSKCRMNTVYQGYITLASYAAILSSVSGGKPPYSYKWSTGATKPYITVNPVANTTYTLTVTDASGCSAAASRQIKVIDVRCGLKQDQVLVCHKNITMCLNKDSVEGYLRKGDCLGSCTENSQPIVNNSMQQAALPVEADVAILKATPNPTNTYFSIALKSSSENEKVYLKVTDLAGRTIEVRHVNAPQTIHLGENYMKGIYLLQVIQGLKTTTLKLVKQ